MSKSTCGAPFEREKQMNISGAMTNNLEAYRNYSLALNLAQAMHNKEALSLLEKAVALDNEFAMACARSKIIKWMKRWKTLPKPCAADLRSRHDGRLLGSALFKLGRFDEAVAEYERILRLNPNYLLARFHLAQVFESKNQTDKARENYRLFLDSWKNADADIPEVRHAQNF